VNAKELARLTKRAREQREWMRLCGGTRAGYIARYGSRDDPDHYGDGGEAIYQADRTALDAIESQLTARSPG
jgi:hypothetical protein